MARVVVLGVAQDGGHPQAGCEAPCCAPAWDDAARAHRIAALGLVDGDRRWLLDATPDLPRQVHALGGLDGVLLTHAHMGHYTGLMHLGREAMDVRGLPLYAMPGMAAFVAENQPWRALLDHGNLALHPLRAEVPLALGRLAVTPWLVPHRGPWTETVAFHVRGPAAAALYLPDIDAWDGWERDLADVIAEVDVAWLDGTFFDADELPGRDVAEIPHPTVRSTMDRLQHLPDALRARVRFVHLNHSNPLLDPDSAASAEVARRGFRVAREGEVLDLG